MADLSPAAQAVWDAFDQDVQEREAVAAVLRAAADLVAPDDYACYTGYPEWNAGMEDRNDNIRKNLLAIAAELEGANG